MINRVLQNISGSILVLAMLCLYGYAVKEFANDSADTFVTKKLNEFVSFPATVLEVFESKEIQNIPPTFEAKAITDTFNNLTVDVFGLNSYVNRNNGNWDVRLFNFKDGAVVHEWSLKLENYNETDRLWSNSEPRNSILLANRNLIVDNDETQNLYRLDANSNIVWHNKNRKFHHAMNLAADGNIWICTTEPRRIKIPQEEEPVAYEDEFITKVDVESGEIVFNKSVSEMFFENGYRNYVYGFMNATHHKIEHDPLHLNDVEPVLADGPYWKQDDLFLSFRHRSLVILYRPSTNKIIRLIHGAFLKQHDVDVLNDSTISIFNNEGTNVGTTIIPDWQIINKTVFDTIDYSNIVQYHFQDSSFSIHFENHFNTHQIFSEYQGFHHYLPDGLVYVEGHTNGTMCFMDKEKVHYKMQGADRLEGLVESPHWIRIYQNIDF